MQLFWDITLNVQTLRPSAMSGTAHNTVSHPSGHELQPDHSASLKCQKPEQNYGRTEELSEYSVLSVHMACSYDQRC
jgi:hypothetical protein